MSKENIRKHPSVKKSSMIMPERDDIPSCDSEQKLTSMSEAKQIQNKIKMRKRSTKVSERYLNTADLQGMNTQLNQQPDYDVNANIVETIEKQLNSNDDLIRKLIMLSVDREAVRQRLIDEANFINCQLQRGGKLSQILEQKIDRYVQHHEAARRVEQKESKILSMIENRLDRLKRMH